MRVCKTGVRRRACVQVRGSVAYGLHHIRALNGAKLVTAIIEERQTHDELHLQDKTEDAAGAGAQLERGRITTRRLGSRGKEEGG